MIFKLFRFQKNIGFIFFDDMNHDLLKTLIGKGIRVELSPDEHESNGIPVIDWDTLNNQKDLSHPSNKTRTV